MRRTHWLSLVVACGAAIVGFAAARPEAAGYHLVKKVVLGGEDGWDYIGVDSVSHQVFVPRHTHVMVVDPDGKVVGDIPNTGWAHGIDFAPELKRGFTSNGVAASLTIFDLGTLQTVNTVKIPDRNPDDLVYDPGSKRVFTFNNAPDNDATAIDAMTAKVVGSLTLGGKPEAGQADGMGQIYVNVPSKSEVVVFDSNKLEVVARWPTAPCEGPSALAIDAAHRRLFAGCHNKMMAMINADTGKVVATVPIGQGVDANKFEPGTGFAFSSCGDGTITVAHEDSPDKLTVVQTIATEDGARTMALDTNNHNIYTVTAKRGPAPAATSANPHPREAVIPNTFTLLIFSR